MMRMRIYTEAGVKVKKQEIMKYRQKSNDRLNRRQLLKYGLYGGLVSSLSGGFRLGGCSKFGFGEKSINRP